MKNNLTELVYVTHSDSLQVMWDGVTYDLGKTPVKVQRGVSEAWEKVYNVSLTTSLVPEEETGKFIPDNPLENDKGVAFEGLKRGRKPRETGE